MKCRDCDCAKRGYFKSVPDAYVCTGVKEPFVISNYPDAECTEYKDKHNKDLEEVFSMDNKQTVECGEWQYSPQENIAICSECRYEHYLGTYHQYATNYCPNCGQKMKPIN